MAHAQKPNFIFRRNGRVHLNRRGRQFSRLLAAEVGALAFIVGSNNAGYTMFRGSVKGTGYPLHSPVSPFTSPPVSHRVPSHFNWSLTLYWTKRGHSLEEHSVSFVHSWHLCQVCLPEIYRMAQKSLDTTPSDK